MPDPGLGTRALRFEVDGTDYSDAVSTCKISAGDAGSDFLTFASAATGGSRSYTLEITTVQSLAASSLWRLTYDSAGQELECVIWPAGRALSGPTAAQPKVIFTAVVAEPDGDWLGGDADNSTTARLTTDLSWALTGRPVITSS